MLSSENGFNSDNFLPIYTAFFGSQRAMVGAATFDMWLPSKKADLAFKSPAGFEGFL
jgi:hypothetical protein